MRAHAFLLYTNVARKIVTILVLKFFVVVNRDDAKLKNNAHLICLATSCTLLFNR